MWGQSFIGKRIQKTEGLNNKQPNPYNWAPYLSSSHKFRSGLVQVLVLPRPHRGHALLDHAAEAKTHKEWFLDGTVLDVVQNSDRCAQILFSGHQDLEINVPYKTPVLVYFVELNH